MILKYKQEDGTIGKYDFKDAEIANLLFYCKYVIDNFQDASPETYKNIMKKVDVYSLVSEQMREGRALYSKILYDET